MSNRNLSPRQFFHGTNMELEEGDVIHPPATTGAKTFGERYGLEDKAGHYRADHVYHSDTVYDARVFGEHVYEVKPLTRVQPDPESAPAGQPQWTRNKGGAKVIRKV